MNEIFVEKAIERLQAFLEKNRQRTAYEILTPDASTREYFRVSWHERTAIACVYGERFRAAEHSYLDATRLFRRAGLPVAEVYAFDENLGIIVQEDFGDRILRDYINDSDAATRDELLDQSIRLIARIQAATAIARENKHIAARLKFDVEKLAWELNFFKTHYFETFRKTPLSETDEQALNEEFAELAGALERCGEVLCHRDFHAANLMLDRENRLRIIDHQDARIGAASYDLVSLLLDRVTRPPADDWLAAKKRFFLAERESLDLKPMTAVRFDEEFDLQTVQRGLKAVGTFSFQSAMRGKTYFIPFIEPMLRIVLTACRRLERFPHTQRIVGEHLNI